MIPFNLTPQQFTGFAFVAFVIIEIIWIASVVYIANERTEDPFDRICWLIIVLLLNILGTILYIFFSPIKAAARRSYAQDGSPYPASARQSPRQQAREQERQARPTQPTNPWQQATFSSQHSVTPVQNKPTNTPPAPPA